MIVLTLAFLWNVVLYIIFERVVKLLYIYIIHIFYMLKSIQSCAASNSTAYLTTSAKFFSQTVGECDLKIQQTNYYTVASFILSKNHSFLDQIRKLISQFPQ